MAAKCKSNLILVFYGRSGAGKSTLMPMVADHFGYAFLDIHPFVKTNKLKYGNDRPNDLFHKSLYYDLLQAFKKGDFQAIEMPSTSEAQHFLPDLFEFVKGKGFEIILIHCVTSFELSRERNAQRTARVPGWILLEQDRFEKEKIIESICDNLKIPIVTIDTSLPLDFTYAQLIERLYLITDLP